MRKPLIIAVSSFIVLLLFFAFVRPFNDWSFVPNAELFSQYGSFVGGFFGTIAALIASILLYKTLVAQKGSFTFERFETTFFNLLKTQRDIKNELTVKFPYINQNFEIVYFPYTGDNFFKSAKNELEKIQKSLEQKTYLSYYSEDDKERDYREIEELDDNTQLPPTTFIDPEEKIKELFEKANWKLCNREYKITKIKWEQYQNKKSHLEKATYIYLLFFNNYHFLVGHYYRHLHHILKHIATQNGIINKKKYFGFLQAQMSSFELMLLFYNSLISQELQKLLVESNLLENLAIEDLLENSHNVNPKIKLRFRSEIIDT